LEKAGIKCFVPDLPNTKTPSEAEQVQFVLDNYQFNENTILFGMSLGAVVAMKVVEKLNKPIAGLILAGGFTSPEGLFNNDLPFEKTFNWNFDFEKIKNNTGFVDVLSDLNDHAVMPSEGRKLHENLGGHFSEVIGVEPHFGAEYEPAIMDALLPKVKVFTTRPDTLFGATYLVLAPEHPMVKYLESGIQNADEVKAYIEATKKKTELQRTVLEKDKTGVELKGIKAINPATKEPIPVWIADYVLANYGTGAIMAVPAHDERDNQFATKFNLPIRVVVDESGKLVESGEYNGIDWIQAKSKIAKEFGNEKIQYKLRDWLVSRQRYWGAPIPIMYCDDCGEQPVPENELPVLLPTDVDFKPTGESPILRSKTFHNAKCPKCGKDAKRDSDTMDTFVDSSWYYFRYTDPHNEKEFASKEKINQWLPVDTYVGGAEHAVLHLLYARFFTKALKDFGLVDFDEPFTKLRNQGLIMGPDGEKMSKSRGNVVNPDEVITEFGADSFRMYEMFMGPLEDSKPWSTTGIVGIKRFLDKVWRFQEGFVAGENIVAIHKLTKRIASDIESFKFNTAISAFMEFLNTNKQMSKENWETFLILLAPFAPHITEELWAQLGHTDSIHKQPWPKYDEKMVVDENAIVVVQVLGRMRTTLQLPKGTTEEVVKEMALADINVQKHIEGKSIVKVIFVPNKLINFVIK